MGQGDTSKEWIRLALMPEKITNGFEPSHITVANKDGSLIRLDQLIKVTRQEEAPQSYYRINGLNSIYLSIRAEETANQLQLAKKVKEEMKHIPVTRSIPVTTLPNLSKKNWIKSTSVQA